MSQWTLEEGGNTLTFTINPYSATYPSGVGPLTTAPLVNGSGVVAFRGPAGPQEFSCEGVVRSQSVYEDYYDWFSKEMEMELTDDHNDSWNVLVKDVKWNRRASGSNHYRYTYSVTFMVV